jgi:hypothetical protein
MASDLVVPAKCISQQRTQQAHVKHQLLSIFYPQRSKFQPNPGPPDKPYKLTSKTSIVQVLLPLAPPGYPTGIANVPHGHYLCIPQPMLLAMS